MAPVRQSCKMSYLISMLRLDNGSFKRRGPNQCLPPMTMLKIGIRTILANACLSVLLHINIILVFEGASRTVGKLDAVDGKLDSLAPFCSEGVWRT